ncbi:MAG: SDR family oxidoreductase [Proteobacteria bacterium]|nr:SDR family oxidoreductase [Pseudomonadota bacterium]
MTEFEVEVTEADLRRFAELSGDWNPLHTDPAYAAETRYRRPILHGAFSAGLVSRMAGMHIPGRDCLLHGMRLRFVLPILPPARLLVSGKLVRETGDGGLVEVAVTDAASGARYVEGSYEFGRHRAVAPAAAATPAPAAEGAPVLVTGASGGLGSAVLARLGGRGLGVSRRGAPGLLAVAEGDDLAAAIGDRRIAGIVHCGWPAPDNQRLTALAGGARPAVGHHVAEPLVQIIQLAGLLGTHGLPGAPLVLVGSTFAEPGRHNFRMPLYSLAKSMVPTLVRILAIELAARNQRCVGVVFDVIDGGMNAGMRENARLAHADRAPAGSLPAPADAAGQIAWVLENSSTLVSGAVLTLSGGALP